ncbi:MAG: 50S ribosomal protein L11 methyltransferase [Bacillota bacterium]|nr:50S ribosomal protein L11 methyltransferase [Bacillota bacterium]
MPEVRTSGSWLEVLIHTSSEAADAIADQLEGLGALGVAVEDPADLIAIARDTSVFIDPETLAGLGSETLVRSWFEPAGAAACCDSGKERTVAAIRDMLGHVACFLPVGSCRIETREIAAEDWFETWKRHYRAMEISARVTVAPTWDEEARAPENGLLIRLDPGMAFGTGSHETTALCIEAIDTRMAPSSRVLDVGTGSGILTIAAAGLGARHVDACDIDPHALKVARENFTLNCVADRVDSWVGSLESARGPYDLILANLLADILIAEAEGLKKQLAPLGLLVASGLITERRDEVLERFAEVGLVLHDELERNDWVALILAHAWEGIRATCPET